MYAIYVLTLQLLTGSHIHKPLRLLGNFFTFLTILRNNYYLYHSYWYFFTSKSPITLKRTKLNQNQFKRYRYLTP